MELVIVAAVSANGVIGKDGGLPWKIPAEEKQYHDSIRGHWGLVGRKSIATEENILPVSGLFVLTRRESYTSATYQVVNAIDDALARAREMKLKKLFILGGTEVYRQTIPMANRMIISFVNAVVEGQTIFPKYDPEEWDIISTKYYPQQADNQYGFEVKEMIRRDNT
jgi:dihydrofolate reductase